MTPEALLAAQQSLRDAQASVGGLTEKLNKADFHKAASLIEETAKKGGTVFDVKDGKLLLEHLEGCKATDKECKLVTTEIAGDASPTVTKSEQIHPMFRDNAASILAKDITAPKLPRNASEPVVYGPM